MRTSRPSRNPFWGLVLLSAAGFCIGVTAYITAGFGERTHPLNQFFNRHGAAVTIGLAIAAILSGGLALRVDRLQTLRQQATQQRDTPSD